MSTLDGSTGKASPGSTWLLVGLGLLAVTGAFLAGRWGAGRDEPAPAPRPALAGPRGPQPAAQAPWSDAEPRAVQPAGPAAAPAPAAPAAPVRATPAMVAQATAEATASLEASRAELTARCWPRDGLAGGQQSTQVTFNVTFDARGREIARGISEDRKARAPEVLRCLQKLRLGSLQVSPPGANVGVRVAMKLP